MESTSRQVDRRLAAALGLQLERRSAALRRGAGHVGWKLGMGDRESIGGEIAVGHLTSATVLQPDSTFGDVGRGDLHADAEVALQLSRDLGPDVNAREARACISGFGVALEIVDLSSPPDDAESVVAMNVLHRAVAFGDFHRTPTFPIEGRLQVNGEIRASSTAPSDLGERLCEAARILAAVGERLRRGDRVITGSVVQVPIAPGDDVVAEMGQLGRVALHIEGR